MPRRSSWTLLPTALTLALLLCSACGESASKGDCKALLERVIKLQSDELGASHAKAAMKEDLAKQQKKLREQLSGPFLKECQNSMPVAVVQCRLKAKSMADFAACDG